jgi:hypothetical protein
VGVSGFGSAHADTPILPYLDTDSSAKLLADGCDRKIPTRSGCGILPVEGENAVGGDVKFRLQGGDQLGESLELRRRRDRSIEVADHANRDARGIDLAGAGGRGSGFLLVPARGVLDFAVAAAGAVADDEVIGQPGRGGTAGGGSALVDVDVFPTGARGAPGGLEDRIESAGFGGRGKRVRRLRTKRGGSHVEQQSGRRGQAADEAGKDDERSLGFLFHAANRSGQRRQTQCPIRCSLTGEVMPLYLVHRQARGKTEKKVK